MSISVLVVVSPKLNRMALAVISVGRFMAVRALAWLMLPVEHADPVETAMPSRSRRMARDSALSPGKEMLSVLGSAFLMSVLGCKSGSAARSSVRK